MRRFCLLLLVTVLALPAAALAARSAPDGSLVVSEANGTVIVRGKGLIYGHLAQARLTILDYKPDGVTVPSVTGAKWWKVMPGTLDVVYYGSDVRFLFPSGKYVLKFEGTGIDISAVGTGTVQIVGAGSGDDGSFVVNGGKPVDVAFAARAAYGGSSSDNAKGNSGGGGGNGNGNPNPGGRGGKPS
jgi:hypothetical protein